MLNFIALPRSTVLVNIVILHFLQVTLLLMFQLVTFIILLNEIFLYSSAPLTSMAAPQPLAGGKDEMNSSLIRNNNNKNTHKAPSAFYFSFPFRGGGDASGVSSPCSCCAPWVRLWQSWRWPRGGDRPALVTRLGMGAAACPALVLLPPAPSFAAAFCWQPGSCLCCRHEQAAFSGLPTRRESQALVFPLLS